MKKEDLEDVDFDNLVSIWTFGCVTANAKIAYKNIAFRYGLDIKRATDLVNLHKELFLHGITPNQLEIIRAHFLEINNPGYEGNSSLPLWLLDVKNEDRRSKTITDLKTADFFSTQTRFNDNSAPSTNEVINWGIEHIERLRKDKRDEKEKWWKNTKEIIIPSATIAIAFLTILATTVLQYWAVGKQERMLLSTIQKDKSLKIYETGFSQKHTAYENFLKYLDESFDNVGKNDLPALATSLSKAEKALDSLEPFIFIQDSEKDIRPKFQKLNDVFTKMSNDKARSSGLQTYREEFKIGKDDIKTEVFKLLFKPPQ